MNPHPYFINPDIDALGTASPEERVKLMRRIAACVGDEAALRSILGIDPEEFASFYPDMIPPELSTEATIDSFISLFARKDQQPDATPSAPAQTSADTPPRNSSAPATEKVETVIPAAPAIDYARMLEEGPDPISSPSDSTSDLISSFLQAVPPKKSSKSPSTPQAEKATGHSDEAAQHGACPPVSQAGENRLQEGRPADHDDLSESLLKIMIKNGNYAKALEIINDLSLNNPKKSVYFAIQTRFLKKLIKNKELGAK